VICDAQLHFRIQHDLTAVTLLENPNPRRAGSVMRAPGGASELFCCQ
jgi:hypothetical protein